MTGLELTVLGVFQARLNGRPLVNFRSAKVRGLLILLALTRPRPHQRDVLAGLLWPDEPEAVARKNLRQALYRLRGLLDDPESAGPSHLLISRNTVELNPESEISVDAETYRAHLARGSLDEAVALYRAELLPGFESTSEAYDDWLRAEREDLRRSFLGALAKLTELHLFRGDYVAAGALARRQIDLRPWSEDAHRQLMRALVLSGDRSGAIAQYQACRTILASELGIQPSTATLDLARRIRNNDLMRATEHQVGSVAERAPAAAPFVGRGEELAALVGAFERSRHGDLNVVVLAGPGGVGKTTLAGRFLDWAAMEGADVLRGRAFATRSGLPYQAVTDLLRRRVERENAPDDLLPDVWLSELSRLLPELRDRYPDLQAPTQDGGAARQHLSEAIAQLGLALARREPTVVFVDDVHWADLASLDVIAYATQRWAEQSAPILLVITVRPEAMPDSAALVEWFDQLSRATPPIHVDLGPLSALESRQLAEAVLVEADPADESPRAHATGPMEEFGTWLYRTTGGNPLLVTETIRALAATRATATDDAGTASPPIPLPMDEAAIKTRVVPALRGVVEGWLTRISPAARTILTAASAVPEDASFERIRALADIQELETAAAVDELIGARLLYEVGTVVGSPQYRFTHELVSDVVADLAGPTRLRLLHQRSLAVLRADGVSAARLVRHALRAGDGDEAFALSLTAAQDAMEDHASAVAVEHFSTAWRLAEERGWPASTGPFHHESLLLGLGRAHELAERWDEAARIYETLLANAEVAGWPSVERRALIRLAGTSHHTTDVQRRARAEELLRRARTISLDLGDSRAVAEVDLELSSLDFHGGDLAGSQRHIDDAMASAGDALDPMLAARHLVLSSLIHIMHRRWPEGEAVGRQAAELYAGDEILTQDALRSVAYCALQSGRPHEALRLLEASLVFCRRIDNVWGETECMWKLAHAHLELGDYGAALKLATHGTAKSRALGVPVMTELSLAVLGTVQRTLFDLDGARVTLIDDIGDVQRETGGSPTLDWVPTELCTISRLRGDWQEAAAYAAIRAEARGDASILTSGLSAWDAVEALLRAGDEVAARSEVARLAAAAAGNVRYQIVQRRSEAVLASWGSDVPAAITCLRDALHLAQVIGLPGEEWPVLVALAESLDRQGDGTGARQAMADAADIVRRLAATIENDEERKRFVGSDPVQAVLARS